MNYKVYKILRIDTNDVVYIGITKNSLVKRFSSHLRDNKNNLKKVNYFKKYKNLLKIELIEDSIDSLSLANEKEIFYIKEYSKKYSLLNATLGGDGTKGLVSWNKGLKCNYKDKLINNSPNKKKVFSYDINGVFLKEYNSIKKAFEHTGVPRSAIKNICELKPRFKTYKKLTFRYYKEDKIQIKIVSEKERIENVKKGKINSSKKILIYDKKSKKEYRFKNYLECINNFEIKKNTLHTYLSINKETKKYIFSYE